MKPLRYLLMLACTTIHAADDGRNLIQEADKLYQENKTEEAKQLYLKEAANGNPEANFNLAYKYSISTKQNYKIAAESGHSDALAHYLDATFFRAETFEDSDILSAKETYNRAKLANPELSFFGESDKIEAISMCIEAGVLDFKQFAEQYGAKPNDIAWEWANKISKKKSNPKLVLQLICQGWTVPGELQLAISDYYELWKKNKRKVFNKCDYAAGNYSMSLCGYKR